MNPTVVLPRLGWQRSPNYSSRHGARVNLVVAHRPAGGYEGSIRTLCDDTRPPAQRVSAHAILKRGGLEAMQLVPWAGKAWTCAAFNSVSDNIEFPDEAWVGRDPHGLAVAARVVAFRLHKRGLPAKWVRGAGLLEGKPGFTRHYDLKAAGGGHTDPTTNDELWLSFCAMVRDELQRGGFRAVWGR